MSTTPDTTTSGGSANADHQASDKGKVASKNAWHRQKTKPLSTTNETRMMTMNFEGNVMICPAISTTVLTQSKRQICIRALRKKYPSMSDVPINMGVR
jgi:hypothetical protein